MKKKMILALVMAMLLTGGVFAQTSAGIGGDFGAYTITAKFLGASTDNKQYGGGFNAFFDATYGTAKLGMFFNGWEGAYINYTDTYLSLSVLGKYPIDLGGFTLFPMLGFEYNIFLSQKQEASGVSVTINRSEASNASDLDQFILQLGVGADFNLTDSLYLRPTLLWGIDLATSDAEKALKDLGATIFKQKLNIGIALGFRF